MFTREFALVVLGIAVIGFTLSIGVLCFVKCKIWNQKLRLGNSTTFQHMFYPFWDLNTRTVDIVDTAHNVVAKLDMWWDKKQFGGGVLNFALHSPAETCVSPQMRVASPSVSTDDAAIEDLRCFFTICVHTMTESDTDASFEITQSGVCTVNVTINQFLFGDAEKVRFAGVTCQVWAKINAQS